jgi:hypothetical protein
VSDNDAPALEELRARLEEEERAYADVLAAVDGLAAFAVPAEVAPEVRERLVTLNDLWASPAPPAGSGWRARLRRQVWAVLLPALERQAGFNSALVQLLNARITETDRLHAQLRVLAGALVRYAQRVQPLLDARARVGTGLATARSELVLDAFSRQLESHARRVDGIEALAARLERLAADVAALRSPR